MKNFEGVVQMQVDSLLETVKHQRAARCREISHIAEQRASKLLKAARRQSRARMHEAIAQERQRIDAALAQARGRVRTAKRRLTQKHYQALLEEGWPLLEACLRARWNNPETRRVWCKSLLAEARRFFGRAPLRIEHPPNWPEEEQAWLTKSLGEACEGAPDFEADEAIACGLRISTPHACLDGTLDGLLAKRGDIEAILLAAWELAAARTGKKASDQPDTRAGHG